MKSLQTIYMTKSTALNSRRHFLKQSLATLVISSLAQKAWATSGEDLAEERRLRFYNLHTDEQLDTVYWSEGAYQPSALAEINLLLRDYRTGEVMPIDRRLLDLLYVLSMTLGTASAMQVISGYRSPATNTMLAENDVGVAKRSLHMEGMAVDIQIPDRELVDVRQAALSLKGGGVGYYPALNFVHLDVGRVRSW